MQQNNLYLGLCWCGPVALNQLVSFAGLPRLYLSFAVMRKIGKKPGSLGAFIM